MPAPLDPKATVAQIAAEHGATAAVFRKYGIDFCCRRDATVAEACRERRLDAREVQASLEDAIAATSPEPRADGRRERSLISHIVENHHSYERRALPYIVSLLAKVAGRHRKRNRHLDDLCDVGQDLADTLDAYIDEAQRRLFPAIASGGCEVVREEMSRRNRELRLLLAHVRILANGYVAPDWGDQSYRSLMEELEALEDDLVERMHVENFALVRATGAP